ncbi:MAG: ABC transporter permease, partial [Cyclobacteriaceae bacterium]
MIRNYILVAWRNLLKNRTFTAINIFGLALSMSICMVIILLIQYHHQFDTFHAGKDRIYRIIMFQKGESGVINEGYATTSPPLGKELKEQHAQVENYVNIYKYSSSELISEKKVLQSNAIFTDNNFFEVFDFDLAAGDKKTALSMPYSIILSEEKANLLFPEGNALGKTVEYSDHGVYKITGIIRAPEGKTHLRFQTIASYNTLPLLANKGAISKSYNDWDNLWSHYNYVLLNENTPISHLESHINGLTDKYIEYDDDEHPGYRFELQPLSEIVTGNSYVLANEMHRSIPGLGLLFFTILAAIVIITASINYANLSVARSLSRAKEVGIRKVNGATKRQIVMQFLVESLIIASISMILAIPFYEFLISSFNEIYIFNAFGIQLTDNQGVYVMFFLFTTLVGLVTGLGPSLFMSKVKTLGALKGRLSSEGFSRSTVGLSGKRVLLSIQFALSIILLVSLFLLKSQGDFLVNGDYGFAEKQVYFIDLQNHKGAEVKEVITSVPGVEEVGFASHHPGVGRSNGNRFKTNVADEDFLSVYDFSVDPGYLDVMGLSLVAGQDFPKNDLGTGREK